MEENDLRDLESLFGQVEDPRMERTKRHRLRDIIILVICGVICGAEGWVEIEEFGKAKEAFFRICSIYQTVYPLSRYLWSGLFTHRSTTV